VLSLEECRSLLGDACPLTDQELRSLRDQLYRLAHLALDPDNLEGNREKNRDPES
jgi:hypothetical protein